MSVTLRARIPAILLLLAIFSIRGWAADDYTLLDTLTYNILNKYEIKNVSGGTVTDLKVKVCVGANPDTRYPDPPGQNESFYQRKLRYRMSPKPSTMTTDALGNTYGEFSMGRVPPGASVTIVIEKFVLNSGIKFFRDALVKEGTYDAFLANKANAQYLLPSPHIESDAEAIRQAAEPYIKLADKTIAERIWNLYQAINVYLTYDESPQFAHRGALHALNTRRGVCTEFSGLFVAFCRAMGVPARVVNGYWARQKTFAPNVAVNVQADRHAWPEFYLPNVGWVPAEPTMIYTVNGQRVPNFNYFAALPTTDRHFIWGYGLEVESMTGISYNYRFTGAARGGDPLDGKIVEESVTLIPGNALPPEAQ